MCASVSDIGVLGLGVMGQMLALNVADHGFDVSVYNRTTSKMEDTLKLAEEQGKGAFKMHGYEGLEAFVASLKRPRRVLLMLTAGGAVDAVAQQLFPLLEEGDIIIDGGNEWYENTEKRQSLAAEQGIHWIGMGVSGGEEGARYGPSMMPGGNAEAYKALQPIVEKCAAQVKEGPCVTYIGPGASGNYVKMVHNGIEYADMQLLVESYQILRDVGGLNHQELHEVFADWNRGELDSFLVEITSKIFLKKDDLVSDGSYLVDKILDSAGNKGTGKWTAQEGCEVGVPINSISAALFARYISSFTDLRAEASSILTGPNEEELQAAREQMPREELIEAVRHALYCSKICAYAQGLHLLQVTSDRHGWDLNLGKISTIWKGGCIIRAVFLDRIRAAYERNPRLANLLLDEDFAGEVNSRQRNWRKIIALTAQAGIPAPAFMDSLAYFDSLRSKRLPANLIQAQRDFFGAHTFLRVDRSGGPFHAIWEDAENAGGSS